MEQTDLDFSMTFSPVKVLSSYKWSAHVSMTAAKAKKLLGTI